MPRVTRLTAAAVAIAALVPATASAAPTIHGTHYQEQITKVCDGLSACEVLFTAVPAAKTLVIREAACVFTMTNTASVAGTSLSGRDAGNVLIQRTVYPVPVAISNVGGARRYQIQSPVNLIMKAGEKPRAFIGATAAPASFSAICTLYGLLG